MLVVCPFCRKARELRKDHLGLVNVPCDCGAVGIINRADSLNLMRIELAGIFQVGEDSLDQYDMQEPVEIETDSSDRPVAVPIMIQWARKKIIPV